MEVESEISKWYRGKAIFITGGTGFMGKVLVEKLLRSCPDVGTIYLLIREKKNMSCEDRMQTMLSSDLFEKIDIARYVSKDKFVAISGDVSMPDLGISTENKRLLQDTVSVVFHMAATVKFHEPLRTAVTAHLEGSKRMLKLCQGMKNLSAIVYVSTAYANCTIPVIQEHVYPAPVDLTKIEHCIAGLDDDLLELVTPRLLNSHPNTYTFTKALTESMLSKYSIELPIVVVRPSIVLCPWKEPKPGWIDSYHGPAALVVAASKGLLKSIYGKKNMVADMVPVDLCINLSIAAAWEIGSREQTKFRPDMLIYNCVSGALKPITWGSFVDEICECIQRCPASNILTIPRLKMTDSRVMHKLNNVVYQIIPATVADCFTWISGGTPRFQYYLRKLNSLIKTFEFFTTQEWEFGTKNVALLRHRMSVVDREIFDFDASKIIWKEYISIYALGIRRNLINEEDDTIDAAKKRVARMALITNIVNCLVLVVLAIIILKFYVAFFES